jgi:hypothetical protein
VIESDAVAVPAVGLAESVAMTVKVDVPVADGVPVIAPAELNERPPGNEPEVSDQEYGEKPPVAASVAEYDTPACAVPRVVVAIATGGAGATTIDSAFVAVAAVGIAESVTFTVKFDVPLVKGVPEIAPVELSERPLGSEPALIDQANGDVPPELASEAE